MQRFHILQAPFGSVGFAATDSGVTDILLMKRTARDAAAVMRRRFPEASPDEHLLPAFQDELGLYFSGRPVCFSTRVDLTSLTEFQRRVLRACARIGYGQTTTYGELARRVGCPAGARAVGGALARNPVPLVIPCHRVVAGNGALGGFSAEQGVSLKRLLLDLEQNLGPVQERGVSCSRSPKTSFYPARSPVPGRGRAGST